MHLFLGHFTISTPFYAFCAKPCLAQRNYDMAMGLIRLAIDDRAKLKGASAYLKFIFDQR
jgi:hypothetical protein